MQPNAAANKIPADPVNEGSVRESERLLTTHFSPSTYREINGSFSGTNSHSPSRVCLCVSAEPLISCPTLPQSRRLPCGGNSWKRTELENRCGHLQMN
jgi:hypothetical protein